MPTPLAQLRQNWKNLLSGNKWSALFEDMQARLRGEAASRLILLRSRHHDTHQKRMQGTLSEADANAEFNRIREALIHLIGQLTEEDMGSGGAEDPLDALVRELRIEIPLTPLYLVNCNRRHSLRFFRRCFGRWQETPCGFQFYYILACPTQEPEGFAERLVYELAGQCADSHLHSVNYRRSGGEERVRIEPLPLGLPAATIGLRPGKAGTAEADERGGAAAVAGLVLGAGQDAGGPEGVEGEGVIGRGGDWEAGRGGDLETWRGGSLPELWHCVKAGNKLVSQLTAGSRICENPLHRSPPEL